MCVVGLTHYFNLWTIPHLKLWFDLACILLSIFILLKTSKGHTSFSFHVLEPSCIRVDSPQGHIVSISQSYHAFLVYFCGKGIKLPPATMTRTPYGVRSSWDFISGRSHECWQVQHHQHKDESFAIGFSLEILIS